MKTRQQYLNKEITHQEYYSQYVNAGITSRVKSSIGEKRIKESTDPHFNDIPLFEWDRLGLPVGYRIIEMVKENGDFNSLSFQVCVNKAAARMIREGE